MNSFTIEDVSNQKIGRKKKTVTEETLYSFLVFITHFIICPIYNEHFFVLDEGYTSIQVATITGTSYRTLRREMQKLGLSSRYFHEVDDMLLDSILKGILQKNPLFGKFI